MKDFSPARLLNSSASLLLVLVIFGVSCSTFSFGFVLSTCGATRNCGVSPTLVTRNDHGLQTRRTGAMLYKKGPIDDLRLISENNLSDIKTKTGNSEKKHTAKEAITSASEYQDSLSLGKIATDIKLSWEPEVATTILKLLKRHKKNKNAKNRPLTVGVIGMPGSGKSTSSEILSSLIGEESLVVPMDGYHYPISSLMKFQHPEDAIYRRGAPDTFDPKSLEKALKRIVDVTGERKSVVSMPGFDHAIGDPQPDEYHFDRNKHNVVICEGIYLLHDSDGWENIKNYFDYTIYISIDVGTCIERLKQRNKCIPGYTAKEIEIRCDEVDYKNAETVARTQKYAHVTVNSGMQ